jgi:glycosyltransferase involved in cell wall biosynthesis
MTALHPGISFIVRAHNEEQTLEDSLRSLFALTIAYEIILILHRCTDASAAIASRLASNNDRIRIFTFNTTIARPGYETLVTDSESPHSIPAYYNWSISHRRYRWTAKWDADFIAPPSLIHYINARPEQWALRNANINLPAVSYTHTERHDYFSSCLIGYMKHVFFEVPLFEIAPDTHIRHTLDPDIFIEHRSNYTKLKTYWQTEPPWFEQEDSDEATTARQRYAQLQRDFGPEPRGLCRSGSPEMAPRGQQILDAAPTYVSPT